MSATSPTPEATPAAPGPYSGALHIPAGPDLLALSRQLRSDAEQTRVRHNVRTAYCAVNIDDLVRYTVAVERSLQATPAAGEAVAPLSAERLATITDFANWLLDKPHYFAGFGEVPGAVADTSASIILELQAALVAEKQRAADARAELLSMHRDLRGITFQRNPISLAAAMQDDLLIVAKMLSADELD